MRRSRRSQRIVVDAISLEITRTGAFALNSTPAPSSFPPTLVAMAADTQNNSPLFPLGLVALPEEPVPLHIFEERYKEMISHCIANESEFGIVWREDDELHDIGCAVQVEEVLETMEDGRINLICRGTRPFRLLERGDDIPYPSGTVEFLEDSSDSGEDTGAETRIVYSELYTEATERTIANEDLVEMSSYDMASTVDFGLEAKQTLLELRDETARLALLERLFRAALKRVAMIGKAEALAGSNGRVRFGTDKLPKPDIEN